MVKELLKGTNMKRKTIVSSNINSVGYDEKKQTLQVEFYNQKVFN